MPDLLDETHTAVLRAGSEYKRELRAFGASLLAVAHHRLRYERAEDFDEHIAALKRLGDSLNAAIDAAYQVSDAATAEQEGTR